MAWKDDLLGASFRGVRFDVFQTEDSLEKALAINEYPFRPGAEVEDLGRRPRLMPMTAVFFGPDYLDGVKSLVQAAEADGSGELIHPVFGSVQAALLRLDIMHDAERPDYAEIRLEFVEAQLDVAFFGAKSAAASAAGAAASGLASASTLKTMTAKDVAQKLRAVAAYPEALRDAVTSRLQGVLDIYDAAREVTRTMATYLETPASYVATVQGCINKVVRDVNSASSRSASALSRLPALSLRFPALTLGSALQGTPYPSTRVYARMALTGVTPATPTPALSLAVSQPYRTDVADTALGTSALDTVCASVSLHAMAEQTAALAVAAMDALTADIAAPAATPDEIEGVVGDIRARVSDLLRVTRAVWTGSDTYAMAESLRTLAHAVQSVGEVALQTRPRLVLHTVASATNFHLLAHFLYADYTRAAELARLNPHVHNPNFIAKGQALYVYAR